ncbi:unnamed protein product, partial [Laminaria digitata]
DGGGGVGGGEEARQLSRTVDFTEKSGYLYKRRDVLRGRLAYRQRYAIIRYPPPDSTTLASRRRAAAGGMVLPPPPPPTLTLLKGRGQE